MWGSPPATLFRRRGEYGIDLFLKFVTLVPFCGHHFSIVDVSTHFLLRFLTNWSLLAHSMNALDFKETIDSAAILKRAANYSDAINEIEGLLAFSPLNPVALTQKYLLLSIMHGI